MGIEDSFKKPHTETYKIRNEIDFDSTIIQAAKENLAKFNDEELEKVKREALSIPEFLGKNIEQKIENLYERTLQYFKEKGFENVNLLPIYLLSEDKMESNGLGATTPTHIEMANLEFSGRETKKQISFIKVLGHELYHSTGQRSVDLFKEKGSKTSNITIKSKEGSFGAAYLSEEEENSTMALEEGMAILFENKIFEQSKNDFPQQSQFVDGSVIEEYQDTLKKVLNSKKYEELLQGLPFNDEMIEVAYVSGIVNNAAQISFSADQYISKKLAEHLIKEIPDFEKLTEDARLNRHTIELARAIEKRFGSGTYRRITTAKTSEAAQVLKELGSDLPYLKDYIWKNQIIHEPKKIEELKQAAKELLECNVVGFVQQAKVNILLAALGLKPLSEFSFLYNIPNTNYQTRALDERMEKDGAEIKNVLENLGLHSTSKTAPTGPFLTLQYEVSLDKGNFDRLEKIQKTWPKKLPGEDNNAYTKRTNTATVHYEQGKMFGFPETAVRAFAEESNIKFQDLPIDIRNSRLGLFIEKVHFFGLSKDHWQDELKLIETWMKSIDEVAPGYIDNIPEDAW